MKPAAGGGVLGGEFGPGFRFVHPGYALRKKQQAVVADNSNYDADDATERAQSMIRRADAPRATNRKQWTPRCFLASKISSARPKPRPRAPRG
jgi:hypothetical protein